MRDWPGEVLILPVIVALALITRASTGTLLLLIAVPVLVFGGLSLMIRRGAFSPRC